MSGAEKNWLGWENLCGPFYFGAAAAILEDVSLHVIGLDPVSHAQYKYHDGTG